jgi:acyl-coenzyme A synthetase/AMP-(fatty) acid ligase
MTNMTDHAATMRDFRLDVPARFNWAFDPKTISGKIRRAELRDMEKNRTSR